MDIYGVLINLVVVALLVISGMHIGGFVVDIYLTKAQAAVFVASDLGSIFDSLYSVPEDISFTYYLPSSCVFNDKIDAPEYLCDQGNGKITGIGVYSSSGPGGNMQLIAPSYLCNIKSCHGTPGMAYVVLAKGYLGAGIYDASVSWNNPYADVRSIVTLAEEGSVFTKLWEKDGRDFESDPIEFSFTIDDSSAGVYELRLESTSGYVEKSFGTNGIFISPRFKEKDIFTGDDLSQGHGWITVTYAIKDETTGSYANHTNIFNAFVSNKNDVCLLKKNENNLLSSFYSLKPGSLISLQSDGGIKVEKSRTNFDSLCTNEETSQSTFKQLLKDINDNFCSPGVGITKTGSSFSWNSEMYGIGVYPSISAYESKWGTNKFVEYSSDSIDVEYKCGISDCPKGSTANLDSFVSQISTRDANSIDSDTLSVITLNPTDSTVCSYLSDDIKVYVADPCVQVPGNADLTYFSNSRYGCAWNKKQYGDNDEPCRLYSRFLSEYVLLEAPSVGIVDTIKLRWSAEKGHMIMFYKASPDASWKLIFDSRADDLVFREDLVAVRDTISYLLVATDRFYTYIAEGQDFDSSETGSPIFIDYIGYNYQIPRNAEDDDKVCLYKVEKYSKQFTDAGGEERMTYVPIGSERGKMKEKSFPEHCVDLSEIFKNTPCKDSDFNFNVKEFAGYCESGYCRSRNLYYIGDYESLKAPYFALAKSGSKIDVEFTAGSGT